MIRKFVEKEIMPIREKTEERYCHDHKFLESAPGDTPQGKTPGASSEKIQAYYGMGL
jgi:hypothetical protein